MSEDLDEPTLLIYLSEIRKASFSAPRPCLPKAFPQTPTPSFPLQTCWTHSETNSATIQPHPRPNQLVKKGWTRWQMHQPYVILYILACEMGGRHHSVPPQIPLVPITRPRPVIITLYAGGERGRTHHSHLAPKARIRLRITTTTDDLAPEPH